jgi:N-acyl-D-aspartate/D-glutamate deacylase
MSDPIRWLLGLLLVSAVGACAPRYDLVIAGGRVMDPESGLDAIRSVGIVDGRVVMISGQSLEGRRQIEARGLVVAPGFIDLNTHGQREEFYRLQVQDGVTTALELEIGTHDVDNWYSDREGGQRINYGTSVGHVGTRAVALGDSITTIFGSSTRDPASPEQIAETLRLIRLGLDHGALGVGLATGYTLGATMDEVGQVFAAAAAADVPAFIHMRGGVAALDSTLTAARSAGTSLHVTHVNSSAGTLLPEFLSVIERARDLGQDVTTDAYPYGASQTAIQSAPFDGWENWPDSAFENFQWAETGERLTRETFGHYRSQGGSVILHWGTDELTLASVASSLTMIASDAATAHPRSAGTFSRVLGRYVREEGVLALMDALRKMTINPARRLEGSVPGFQKKGRIRIGADADITLFDPETILDRATYSEPTLSSIGIEYVIVNGVVVVEKGGVVEDARPGAAVRRVSN